MLKYGSFGSASKLYQKNLPRLHTIGKAMIIRRTKDEVNSLGNCEIASIPPKTVENVDLTLQEEEAVVYNHLLEFAKQKFNYFLLAQEERKDALQNAANKFVAGKQKKKDQPLEPMEFAALFALLSRLRQAAVLPYLINVMLEDDDSSDDLSYDALVDPINVKNPVFEPGYKSSKIRAVFKELAIIRAAAEAKGVPMDKVIIVSQWTMVLNILSQHLQKKGYSYDSLTGEHKVAERTEIMRKFNSNPKKPQVLLLSLTAGGVGLNLVGANYVFFMEPHWNPQIEKQAQDRVHRFGQTKPVFIKRFIANGTMEEKMLEVQQNKLELSEGLLNNAKMGKSAGLNLQDMRKLFDL